VSATPSSQFLTSGSLGGNRRRGVAKTFLRRGVAATFCDGASQLLAGQASESPGQRVSVVNSAPESSITGASNVNSASESSGDDASNVNSAPESSFAGASNVSSASESSFAGASNVSSASESLTDARQPGDKARLFAVVYARTGGIFQHFSLLTGKPPNRAGRRPRPSHLTAKKGSPLFSVEWGGWGMGFWPALEEPGKLAGGKASAPPPEWRPLRNPPRRGGGRPANVPFQRPFRTQTARGWHRGRRPPGGLASG
jgi:hypothetical protein